MSTDQESRQPLTPETVGSLFVNARGELINAKVELLVDPDKGAVWQEWASRHLPADVFRAFGMIETEGSDEWLNVVEHNIFVAAASLNVGQHLGEAGLAVNLPSLVRSAIVHDAAKRLDVARKLSREAEVSDTTFESVVSDFGYTPEEIAAAKNTGRLPDRYEQNPVERLRAIANKSVEANIIGYVDARTRNVHLVSLDQAMADSIMAKPNDEQFFSQNWRPYYDTVERYFQALAPSFDPNHMTDETVFTAMQETLLR